MKATPRGHAPAAFGGLLAPSLVALGIVSSAAVVVWTQARKRLLSGQVCNLEELDGLAEESLRGVALRLLVARSITVVKVVNQGPKLSVLPPGTLVLPSLVELDLSGNALSSLPAAISNLPNITKLNLSCNQLTSLPAEIGTFQNLKDLDLGRNKLTSLPAQIGNLQSLKFLNLMANELSELPPEIGNLKALYRLGLKSNKLRELPPSIGGLTSMVELFLTDNLLEELPKEMGQLKSLVKFQASFNRLQALPAELCHLSSLELFRVAVNCITQIPSHFDMYPKLAWLSLAGNPACAKAPQPHPGIENINFRDLTLEESLGEGASGDVFAASWRGEAVVFKRFKAETSPDGHAADEIAITCAVDSPCLIKVLGLVEEPRGLVLKRVHGRPLAEKPNFESLLRCRWGKDRHLSLPFVLRAAECVARALESLHALRICHGDVYAHNVIADEEGFAVLCDYGASFHYPEGPSPFEAQEVRAFGLLLNDMWHLVLSTENDTAYKTLGGLVEECLRNVQGRPTFSRLCTSLGALLKAV